MTISELKPSPKMTPLEFTERLPQDMAKRATEFRALMQKRRSVRNFSDRSVDAKIIENCIMSASSAPSGANQQPWRFFATNNPQTKNTIRLAAEEEEASFYAGRAGDVWLDALSHLGTNAQKPFLETAPWLIAIFSERWGIDSEGNKIKHYYVPESIGIATGILIAALHNAGLATLTHTPAPMGFLNQICGRPDNEKPFLLLVTGYPAVGAEVPDICRKDPDNVILWDVMDTDDD